jgi:SRSO17 transposase
MPVCGTDQSHGSRCCHGRPAGHALIGRALYLPADWAADEERRELAGVPDEVMFATKPELAGQLLKQAHDCGIRASFTVGDEVYGGLDLRRSIRELGTGYVMAVRSNYAVILPSGRRLTVKRPGTWSSRPCGSGCVPAPRPKAPRTTTGR